MRSMQTVYFLLSTLWQWKDWELPLLLETNTQSIDIIHKANIIQIYSGITGGRVLDGELLYIKILEVLEEGSTPSIEEKFSWNSL